MAARFLYLAAAFSLPQTPIHATNVVSKFTTCVLGSSQPSAAAPPAKSQPAAPDPEQLERRLRQYPDDLDARDQLTMFYFWQSSPSARLAHARHVLWVIRHHPDSDLAGHPQMSFVDGTKHSVVTRAGQLWREQISAHPRNAKIIGNAARWFLKQDPTVGFRLLTRAQAVDPNDPQWPQFEGDCYSEDMNSDTGSQHREAARRALLAYERWWRLTGDANDESGCREDMAVAAFEAGELYKARLYATKLLEMPGKRDGHGYGNAIHKGNLVLGRVALKSGDTKTAVSYLLASGKTPGSPELDSFGPNMSLAKELLEKGQRQAVLEYFALCATFWREGELALWTKQVERGKMPDFSANLVY